jgi:hypothetical protein
MFGPCFAGIFSYPVCLFQPLFIFLHRSPPPGLPFALGLSLAPSLIPPCLLPARVLMPLERTPSVVARIAGTVQSEVDMCVPVMEVLVICHKTCDTFVAAFVHWLLGFREVFMYTPTSFSSSVYDSFCLFITYSYCGLPS